MQSRLKSGLWVRALIRRYDEQAIPATVLRNGDEDAGAIFVKVSRRERACGVSGIVEEYLLLSPRHQSEAFAWLLPMIIVDAMVPMGGFALDWHRRLGEVGLVLPKTRAVGMITERSAEITVRPHLAVAMIAVERALRSVDRDVIEVDAEPIALRVAIGEQPRLEHLVGREADAGDDGLRREGRLLHLGEVVLRIAVQRHHPRLDQR